MPQPPSSPPYLSGLRFERVRASTQLGENGRFRNPSGARPELDGPSWPVMRELLFGRGKRRPPGPIAVESPLEAWTKRSDTRFRVTWLGHSTVLLELDGLRVLTDPVFGEHVSPVRFAGVRRFHAVPATIAQLPPVDAILLSHDHYDHLCASSMRELARLRVPVITSLGVGARLERMGVDPAVIVELDWWEQHTLPGHRLRFTATPAQHFSGRTLTDRNRTLWSSWVIESDRRKVFFSGDTGLTLRAPFVAAGLDVGSIFYGGESVLSPSHRGQRIYGRFLAAREAHARDHGFSTLTFCAVQRPADHPARPPGYVPLDAVWQHFGYVPRPDLRATMRWRDHGEPEETEKPMTFWTKAL